MNRSEQKRRAIQRYIRGLIDRFNPFLDPNDYVMKVLHAQLDAIEDHRTVSEDELASVIRNIAEISQEISYAESTVREYDAKISSYSSILY